MPIRSFHGTQAGATSAASPGISTTSLTVTCLRRGARAIVTAQRQPSYPAWVLAKRWVTTRSASATTPTCSPNTSVPTISVSTVRASSTAATSAASVFGGLARLGVTAALSPMGCAADESPARTQIPTSRPVGRRHVPRARQDRHVPSQDPPRQPPGGSRPDYGQAGHLAGSRGPTAADRARSAGRSRQARRRRRGTRRGRCRPGGPPGRQLVRCRGVRAVASARAQRVQLRRRRRADRLARGHLVLHRTERRGARAGGAVSRRHDAAVRDRGAADRPVPRPVPARSPLGDRHHLRGAGVRHLGAGQRGRQRLADALPGGAHLSGGVQGVRRHPGLGRPTAAATRPHPGEGELPPVDRCDRRCGRVRPARGRRRHGGRRVVAALRRLRVRRWRHPLDPAAAARRLVRGRGAGRPARRRESRRRRCPSTRSW